MFYPLVLYFVHLFYFNSLLHVFFLLWSLICIIDILYMLDQHTFVWYIPFYYFIGIYFEVASFETYTCLAYFSSPWSVFKHHLLLFFNCVCVYIYIYILYMIDSLILILYLLSFLWVNPLFYVSILPYFTHFLKYVSFLSWFISFIFMPCFGCSILLSIIAIALVYVVLVVSQYLLVY